MRSALLLAILLTTLDPARAQNQCVDLFKISSPSRQTHEVMATSWALHSALENLPLFGRTKRARRKERQHIADDLKGVEEQLERLLKEKPYLEGYLERWQNFNAFWLEKIKEFESLPPKEQKKLSAQMEIPLSIGLKHLISFLESPHHRRWKLERLNQILSIHTEHPTVDLKASLFLIDRETRKYFSRWDFTRCKY